MLLEGRGACSELMNSIPTPPHFIPCSLPQCRWPLWGRGRASFQAEKHPKWQEIAISRGCVHFQQMLRQTKAKSKKFRIRWSKVPRVLELLKSSYGCSRLGLPPQHWAA